MKADERRKEIAAYLMSQKNPVSGGNLSERFGVSRQIIVQDISVLKAAGYEILSTHSGYVVQHSPQVTRVFKVRHTKEQTEDELTTVVSHGGVVEDVFVWHKVYGKIEAILNISTPEQVQEFMAGIRAGKSAELLMNVTDGYHYHTVRADTEEILDKIAQAISPYLVPEEE